MAWPDVLLHVTCLRRDGYQTAYEGARVVCEVLPRPKGLQAFRVISMDESTAIHPAQMPPPRTHVTVAPTSGLERAQVKWFNRLRGFGFLTRGEGTPDIFVHMETLRRFGLTELRPGQFVLVRFGPGPKGMMAAEVRPEGGTGRSHLALTLTLFPSRIGFARLRRACSSASAPCCRFGAGAGGRQPTRSRSSALRASTPFRVELATTDAEREKGLMFRKELPEGQGMLFDFQRDQPVAFWMHNTLISLDMLFIRGDGRIMRIAENAKPESDDLIPSGVPVRGVLEVIAGTARDNGHQAGRSRHRLVLRQGPLSAARREVCVGLLGQRANDVSKAAIERGIAQPGSAAVLGTAGRRFKSCCPDHLGR